MIHLGVVILAAGRSSRMGQPKLLLPWTEGRTVIAHLVHLWSELGADPIAVVIGPQSQAVVAELDRLQNVRVQLVLNDRPEDGMFSSIQAACGKLAEQTSDSHWAIALGDQPHLTHSTLSALISAVSRDPAKIWQPAHHGRPRHPVVLPANVFKELSNAGAATFKDFLAGRRDLVALLETDDDLLDYDLDTPSDYEMLLRRVSPETTPRNG
jgi:molybdenum cofactor cytidylyltransferase